MPLHEAICDNCGNSYDKAFQITLLGVTRTFDSFECAINVMAPECEHCDTKIIGHGVEQDGKMYCCAHCAEHEGVKGLKDRDDDDTKNTRENINH